MKKVFFAFALAFTMMFIGCDGGSHDANNNNNNNTTTTPAETTPADTTHNHSH